MPCLSGQYDPAIGVLLEVGVLPGGSLDPQSKPDIPSAPVVGALLDTGADNTCISPMLARSLDIKALGKMPVVGATGSAQMNRYMIDMILRFGVNNIIINNHLVTEFKTDSPNYKMLIGRDIICQGVLTMEFSGHFSFSV